MSLQKSASLYQEGILAFVWRQWGQLGASVSVGRRDDWCQDPEALLAFTLEVARWDPRMFDETLDWLMVNGHELMRQRLKNLMVRDPKIPGDVIEAAFEVADPKKNGAKALPSPARNAIDLEPLFRGEGEVTSAFGPPDPAFQAHGLMRPLFRRSGKSSAVRRKEPLALAFRLRAAFGASARSEALRYLLVRPGRQAGTVELADAALLSRFGLQKTLEDLAAAGLVQRGARSQRDLLWWLEDPSPFAWLRAADGSLPTWVGWPSVFHGLALIWRWLLAPERAAESPYIQASGAKALMCLALPYLTSQGLRWRARDPNEYKGGAYLEVFQDDVAALLGALND